jgi:protein CpxP
MNTDAKERSHDRPPHGNCRTPRTLRLSLFAILLLGMGAVAGALLSAAAGVAAHGGFGHWGHRGGVHSLEQAQDRAQDIGAWLGGTLDATPEQSEQVNGILTRFVEKVYPLAEQHRQNRRLLLAELARPTVDPQALEQVRRAELGLADTASGELVQAVTELAEVLTPEQRQHLVGLAAKRGR